MLKVLIVDDEEINRILLREIVKDVGLVECYAAKDGESALQLAKQISPDIVLLDVMLPGMSGLEVAARLKADSRDYYLPILFITSLDDRESLVKCFECGGDDFISKPFDKLILNAKLTSHTRARTMSLELSEKHAALAYYQEEVERSHRIVEHIFDHAIVQNDQAVQYFDYFIQPESQFNGDLFLCETSPSGGAYLFIGDFTGHGLASAIGAIPVTQAFVTMSNKGLAVEEMARSINNILYSLLPADLFCVACIAHIQPTGESLTVWSGGLPRIALKSADNSICKTFDSQHMPLGILDKDEFESYCDLITMNPGDTLLFYTDGLMESQNKALGMLGEVGVEQWFVEQSVISSKALFDKAIDYRGGASAEDDITIVQYRCQPFHFSNESEIHLTPLPFTLSFDLTPEHFGQNQLIDQLVQVLNNLPGLVSIRSELFTVLTELVNNAIEHGILKLSSTMKEDPEGFIQYYELRQQRLLTLQTGVISIAFSYDSTREDLTISVKDSGAGYQAQQPKTQDDHSYGRGLNLVSELCNSVEVTENGTRTMVLMNTKK